RARRPGTPEGRTRRSISGRHTRRRRQKGSSRLQNGYRAAMPPARTPPGRPALRGLFHAWAFWLAIPAGVVLFVLAEGSKARVAAAVFGAAVAGMFGASGLYHRFSRSEDARRALRRLDQVGIFGLIAGSYTAVGLLVLGGTSRVVVLAIVWTGVVVGIVVKFAWAAAPKWISAAI